MWLFRSCWRLQLNSGHRVSEPIGILLCQTQPDSLFAFVSQWIEKDFYQNKPGETMQLLMINEESIGSYDAVITIFTRSFTESTPKILRVK